MIKKIGILVALTCLPVFANDIGDYVGYTIVGVKTVVGYVDEKKEKRADSFEGCDYERKIIFEDDTFLTCRSYHYHYAYRPKAFLLVRDRSWVMLVGDDAYEMRN